MLWIHLHDHPLWHPCNLSCDHHHTSLWLVLWLPHPYSVLLSLSIYLRIILELSITPYDVTLLTHPSQTPPAHQLPRPLLHRETYAIHWWLRHLVTINPLLPSCLVYASWLDDRAPQCLVIWLHHSLWLLIHHIYKLVFIWQIGQSWAGQSS